MEQRGVPLGQWPSRAPSGCHGGTTHVRVLANAPVGREQHLKHTPTINIYGSGGWEVFDWWFVYTSCVLLQAAFHPADQYALFELPFRGGEGNRLASFKDFFVVCEVHGAEN